MDKRLKEVQRQSRVTDTQSLAVMAALQIAEELLGERKATAALKRRIRERSESLLQFLEREGGV